MYYINESDEQSYDKKYRCYKIRKGDTLQSVALELGKESQELRHYHNMRCAIPDLIEEDFKSHLELLILAPEEEESVEKSEKTTRKKVVFGSESFTIPFYPVNVNNSYGVKYSFQKGDEIKLLEYQASVNWLQADKNGICFFEINRLSKVKINGKEAETKVDILAEMAASVLYPLQVVVDQNGNWIDILNFETIKERWEYKKNEIVELNDGKNVLNYISEIEETLKDADSLLETFSDDWFLKTFFSGVHTCYGPNLAIEKEISFPIMPKKAVVAIDVEQKIEEHLDDANLILIRQKGEITDEKIKDDFLLDSDVLGNYEAEYYLNPNHYAIEKIILQCTLDTYSSRKVTIEINNLKEKKDTVLATRQSIFIAEEKKKNSFFKGLFSRS